MTSERALADAYRVATLTCPLQGQGCPTSDDLADAVAGRLEPARREAIVAIVANCARCAALMQVAGDLEPVAETPAPRRSRVPLWIGGIAAAAVLAVFAPRFLVPNEGSITRGNDGPVQPAPGATLDNAPSVITWSARDGTACRVTVRSAAADVVLNSGSVAGGRLELNAAERARLIPGEYLWTAECGGNRVGPYAFSVRP
jgi:hypothetical protein